MWFLIGMKYFQNILQIFIWFEKCLKQFVMVIIRRNKNVIYSKFKLTVTKSECIKMYNISRDINL